MAIVPSQDTIVAIIGALTGGFGVKALDHYFQFKEKHIDADKAYRSELHERIIELLAEVKAKAGETDSWRDKYYALYADHCALKAKVDSLWIEIATLTGENPPSPPS